MSGHILDCHNLGERFLLASGEERPGMLPSFLQCLGQSPPQGATWPGMPVVLRLRNPDTEVGQVPVLRSCYEDKKEKAANIFGIHKIIEMILLLLYCLFPFTLRMPCPWHITFQDVSASWIQPLSQGFCSAFVPSSITPMLHQKIFIFYKCFILIVFICGHTGSSFCSGFSLVATRGSSSLASVHRLLTVIVSLVAEYRL